MHRCCQRPVAFGEVPAIKHQYGHQPVIRGTRADHVQGVQGPHAQRPGDMRGQRLDHGAVERSADLLAAPVHGLRSAAEGLRGLHRPIEQGRVRERTDTDVRGGRTAVPVPHDDRLQRSGTRFRVRHLFQLQVGQTGGRTVQQLQVKAERPPLRATLHRQL